eukprot:CAMPEP_0174260364 /NCGR_PEP_ID=MMETSP0439-20130205/9668_1 /TAXON_ID=0 /ORGANISM="Stereomyxa ramosa, Strain Chinc5" /LENGTH=400 /DNA_ID=CAMNT_0015344591 /DNA_START=131 /DNA_END=1330 /DNA_ORIENTATION=-
MAMSDTLGHNPQHEFGSVYSRRMTPLLPYWRLEGDAFANQDFVRIVPDRQSKKGAMWNSEPCRYTSWEVTLKLEIHGVSAVGADGMVFWYVENPSQLTDKEKSFFGYTDKFKGLGVVLDTYDNDNTGLHPLLGAIVNDGSKSYTHDHGEHEEEEEDMEVGYCQLQIRNLGSPSLLRVTYSNPGLRVEHQLANSQTWVTCLEAPKVNLPPHYYFGLTAATGQLADNHDVYGLTMRNLAPDAQTVDSQRHFSQFDKYQISEYLSKIYYEVARPKSVGAQGSGGGISIKQIKDAVSSVTGTANVQSLKEQLDLVYDGLLDVTDSLEKLEKAVASRPQATSTGVDVRTLTQVVDNQKTSLTEEIRSVKSEIYSLQNHLSGMSQMTSDLKHIISEDSDSGSGVIW